MDHFANQFKGQKGLGTSIGDPKKSLSQPKLLR